MQTVLLAGIGLFFWLSFFRMMSFAGVSAGQVCVSEPRASRLLFVGFNIWILSCATCLLPLGSCSLKLIPSQLLGPKNQNPEHRSASYQHRGFCVVGDAEVSGHK